ncbi:MAG: glycosyltransferase family 4 protein [Actinomycetota bacterium]
MWRLPVGVLADSSLRVVHVVDSFEIGGAQKHVIGLAAAAQQMGVRCHLAVATGGPFQEVAVRAGLSHRVFGLPSVRRRYSTRYVEAIRKYLEHVGADVVHGHIFASAVAAAEAAQAVGVPFVVTQHSLARWRTERDLVRIAQTYRRAALIVAVSDEIAEAVRAIEPTASQRVIVMPNVFLPTPDPLSDSGFRLPPGPRVLCAARLVAEKDVGTLLAALARLAGAGRGVRCVVVGDGPQRAELEKEVIALGVARMVDFVGPIILTQRHIRAFDVVVVPSVSEGSPLIVLEARAAGVPIVATAVGGIPFLIRNRVEALLVPPQDPDALATAIADVLSFPDQAARRAARARGHAAQTSPAAYVAKLTGHYTQLPA